MKVLVSTSGPRENVANGMSVHAPNMTSLLGQTCYTNKHTECKHVIEPLIIGCENVRREPLVFNIVVSYPPSC